MDPLNARLRGLSPRYIPLWFMRQAGRVLPEYLELKKNNNFIRLCKTPKLAIEVTLQPLRRWPIDAAIIFSDILFLPEAMGMELVYDGAPRLRFASGKGIENLAPPDRPDRNFSWLGEALDGCRRELTKDRSLIGFAGTPFTLLYFICKHTFPHFTDHAFKVSLMSDPALFRSVLDKLTQGVIQLLHFQFTAGADVAQLFDTHGGILSPEEYAEWNAPWLKKIGHFFRKRDLPLFYFLKNGAHLVSLVRRLPIAVYSFDYLQDPGSVAKAMPRTMGLQGNLDPDALFLPREQLSARVRDICRAMGGRRNFIFNLGHGVPPEAPLEGIATVVETVHDFHR